MEATGRLAAALHDRRRGGDVRLAEALLRQIRNAQAHVGQGQKVGGRPLPPRAGVVAASSLIDSEFGSGYFQVPHNGATAWYLMAVRRSNPMQAGGLLRRQASGP